MWDFKTEPRAISRFNRSTFYIRNVTKFYGVKFLHFIIKENRIFMYNIWFIILSLYLDLFFSNAFN